MAEICRDLCRARQIFAIAALDRRLRRTFCRAALHRRLPSEGEKLLLPRDAPQTVLFNAHLVLTARQPLSYWGGFRQLYPAGSDRLF